MVKQFDNNRPQGNFNRQGGKPGFQRGPGGQGGQGGYGGQGDRKPFGSRRGPPMRGGNNLGICSSFQ